MTRFNTESNGKMTATERVFMELRRCIIDGTYQPGEVLPTYSEMCERFGVSRAVLQRVMQRLCDDGFADAVPRSHMFVRESLPNQNRYGLVFGQQDTDHGYRQTYQTIMDAAQKIADGDLQFQPVPFAGAVEPLLGKDVRRQIIDDVHRKRLAGLIYGPGGSNLIYHFPELDRLDIPRVFLGESERWGTRPNVTVNQIMFLERALKRLADSGRKNVAVVHMANTYGHNNHAELFVGAGLEYHESWVQSIARDNARNTARLMQLLFDPRFGVQPDGLIIADDNLLDYAVAGLLKVGVRLGEDLEVVAYSQWPCRTKCHLPITRLGFNITELMQMCIDSIKGQQDGREVADISFAPAVFETELAQNLVLS